MSTAGAGARPSAGNPDGVQDHPQIAASIEFWMRAYPRRWRAARGEELADLVVDLAGPQAQRLGPRGAFDLVRGGWATRWREHPPFHTWLLYRMFDSRIPRAYRSWALDDIDGFWYLLRRYLPGILSILLFLVFMRPWPSFVIYLALPVLASVGPEVAEPDRSRGKARLRHLMPMAGEPLVEGTFLAFDVPRDRASARSALHWAILLSGAVVALSLAASVARHWTAAPPIPGAVTIGPTVPSLVALVLGVLTATIARRRLTRLLGECPAQPDRVLRPVSVAVKVRGLFWTMFIAYTVWLDLTPSSFGLSVLIGAAALILLFGSVAALLVVRGGEAGDLAGDDVWLIAGHGRPPAVDQPVPALRPQPGPVPDGSVVQPRIPADPPYPAIPGPRMPA